VVSEATQSAAGPGSTGSTGSTAGTDAVVPVAVGTLAWAVALALCLLFRARLTRAGDGWWIWVCATGCTLGVLGSAWVRRRRAVGRRAVS